MVPLFASKGFEKGLIFITACGEGHANELSRFFDMKISPIQNEFDQYEVGGVLVSATRGECPCTRLIQAPFSEGIEIPVRLVQYASADDILQLYLFCT